MIDETDRQILTILQDNGRTNNADVARQVGMAASGTLERIRKLEKRGVIQRYEARIDPVQLGLRLLAFVFVKTNQTFNDDTTADRLVAIPEVQEVHHVAGEDCYLVKVRAADPQALGKLLRETFAEIPSIVSTRSTIVLETLKESSQLPLPAPADATDHA
jgi:Lrp/AsnC family transcriptional regulator, leucine-responsive regulatory protein